MHLTLLLASLLCLPHSFAQDPHGGGGFETNKQNLLKNLDERITSIQKAKTCVQAATSRDAMQICRRQMQEDGLAARKSHLDNHIENLKEKRAELDQKGVLKPQK